MRLFAYSGCCLAALISVSSLTVATAGECAFQQSFTDSLAQSQPASFASKHFFVPVQLTDPNLDPPSMDDLESFPEADELPDGDAYGGSQSGSEDEASRAHGGALDKLFVELGQATDVDEARVLSARIQQLMLLSGSHTVDLLMHRASQAMRLEQYGLALDLLDAVVRLRPAYAEGWNRRATVHYLREDFGQSLSDIEQVLRLEPRHFPALTGLGMILRRMEQDKKALEVYEHVLSINPMLESAQEAVRELKLEMEADEI
ncbi:tetratricopeptide repeat protein [Pseudovibrio exalbescens]|uniref:tetratricopeptide repeat protein n=1 Tax=Pseudovibrio exalbescens TaxID=197461 RepID=UPI00236620E0|nr:tetratricopeptide repeat protein [Pseudovibrio exalbescens]MDD7911855.1 tetratricopeptide repeat protein [Pseudovibrio exalbescens]